MVNVPPYCGQLEQEVVEDEELVVDDVGDGPAERKTAAAPTTTTTTTTRGITTVRDTPLRIDPRGNYPLFRVIDQFLN